MNNGVIVCNARPLIALSLVGNLDLLQRLYDRVLAPEAVVREVVESGAGRAGAIEVEATTCVNYCKASLQPTGIFKV